MGTRLELLQVCKQGGPSGRVLSRSHGVGLEARLKDVFPFALIAVHRKAPVSALLRHLVPMQALICKRHTHSGVNRESLQLGFALTAQVSPSSSPGDHGAFACDLSGTLLDA